MNVVFAENQRECSNGWPEIEKAYIFCEAKRKERVGYKKEKSDGES